MPHKKIKINLFVSYFSILKDALVCFAARMRSILKAVYSTRRVSADVGQLMSKQHVQPRMFIISRSAALLLSLLSKCVSGRETSDVNRPFQ